MNLSRRQFLSTCAAGASLGSVSSAISSWAWAFSPRQGIENPLASYPARDWERIYRDQYAYDSKFTWVCSPNDTHACRVTAHVRNGVIVRMGSDYRYQDYRDLYGNHATANWNPLVRAGHARAVGASPRAGVTAALAREGQRSFLEQHLLRWAPACCARFEESPGFHAYAAELVRRFLERERERFSLEGDARPAALAASRLALEDCCVGCSLSARCVPSGTVPSGSQDP